MTPASRLDVTRTVAVAKRAATTTWRDAVAARAAEAGSVAACLAAFDALRAAGATEADAAFRTLDRFDLLWRVALPGATAGPAEDPTVTGSDRDDP